MDNSNKHNYYPYVVYYDRTSDYIQNVTFNYDAYYEHTPMSIGWGVEAAPVGDVIVKSGHKLSVKNGTGGVLIESGFECKKGGVFEIK